MPTLKQVCNFVTDKLFFWSFVSEQLLGSLLCSNSSLFSPTFSLFLSRPTLSLCVCLTYTKAASHAWWKLHWQVHWGEQKPLGYFIYNHNSIVEVNVNSFPWLVRLLNWSSLWGHITASTFSPYRRTRFIAADILSSQLSNWEHYRHTTSIMEGHVSSCLQSKPSVFPFQVHIATTRCYLVV